MINQIAKKKALKAGLIMMGLCALQSCDKDVLLGQPDWLGNSIYERLQEGIDATDGSHKTFDYTLRLISDIDKETKGSAGATDYVNTLSRTGSRTLFVGSDEAYDAWFKSNSWGVTSYDQLTTAQKKLLFNSSMISNAYLLEKMSSSAALTEGTTPQNGQCMRRETSASIYDSIPTMQTYEMPVNALGDEKLDVWKQVRNAGHSINIFKDATTAPMIHFIKAFMEKQNITDADLYTLTNGVSNSIEDSWINGKKVISDVQTCKNGYVYVVDGLPTASQSMAELIKSNSQTTMWASFLNRFSCPVKCSSTIQSEWRRLCNKTENDTVYDLRYLNNSGNHALQANDAITTSVDAALKYDPGWNAYIYNNADKTLQNDAGAMLVPTDQALNDWWQTGGGKSLRTDLEKTGRGINDIPYKTLASLINVNMLESFVNSTPSKFSSVLDDNGDTLNITLSDIKDVYMGCNGVVYVTNKVFTPAAFRSVIYPSLAQSDGDYEIIYNALKGYYTSKQDATVDFSPYLNAKDSRFSFIIPLNNTTSQNPAIKSGVFRYLDPCSYGCATMLLWEFYYDIDDADVKLKAYYYPCTQSGSSLIVDWNSGQKATNIGNNNYVKNRLYDIIDNNVIVHEDKNQINDGQLYYQTKGGSVVMAKNEGNETLFKGGYQILNDMDWITAKENDIYNMKNSGGNGITYGVANANNGSDNVIDIPLSSPKSVYEVLKETSEAGGPSLFFNLLLGDETEGALLSNASGSYKCANYANQNNNINVFDNFQYTVYVPSDTAIINAGIPTWTDYKNASTDAEKEKIAKQIESFLRYHIQDNSVYINGGNVGTYDEPAEYETALLNTSNNRFYGVKVISTQKSLKVKGIGNKDYCNVLTSYKYNVPCREYWIKGTPGMYSASIQSSSNAVVHFIDGALLYK